ncbi:MAG: M3 family metallopeptidase, partial [Pacificimonas sp.]
MIRNSLVASASALALAACTTTTDTAETSTTDTAETSTMTPMSDTAESFNMTEPHDVLLAEWDGPHGGMPPFNLAERTDLFEPAIDEGINRLRADIAAIAADTAPATFDNVFVPMEEAGAELGRATTLFYTLTANRNTPEIQEIAKRVNPKLTAVFNEINFNDDLFARIKSIHDGREAAGLTAEQKRLVEKTYDRFVRSGAMLGDVAQSRVGDINTELSTLFTNFSQRVLADESKLIPVSAAAVESLPEALQSTYAGAAEDADMDGYAVANTRSAVQPFLTFSDDRDARETVWRAFVNRGDNADENDTNDLIAEIVKLRAERAKLLGFDSHAHYRMADTMAQDPERAMD